MSPVNHRDHSILINNGILKLVSTFASAQSIGLFYPYKNEVDVLLMVSELEKRGLTCLLPKVIDKHHPLKYFFILPAPQNWKKDLGALWSPPVARKEIQILSLLPVLLLMRKAIVSDMEEVFSIAL